MLNLDDKNIIQKIEKSLKTNPLLIRNKEIVLRKCFNETWFSDTLAWLLNPKGSHQLGVRFAKEFLKVLAKARSHSSTNYMRKKSMLKWGKEGRGTSISDLSLKNASSVREFYLAKSIMKREERGARFCDVILVDLDLAEGLFMVVENKLFSSNHPEQLQEYYDLVEDKFDDAKIREYAYLTLNGMPPIKYSEDNSDLKSYRNWVNISWTQDILKIITKLKDKTEHKEVKQLQSILEWLNKLQNKSITSLVEEIRKLFLKATAQCLIEELQRLGKGMSGEWKEDKTNLNHISISHSSSSTRQLFVELLPNFSITIQSRKSKKALYEKIIIPFGIHPNQLFNLIDIAARDVYHLHFDNGPKRYLSGKRRRSIRSERKQALESIFNFAYQRQYELKIILASSKYVWEAEQFENQESN